MGTPLYTTDIIPLTSRPTLTVMDDGDYFVILDTNTGKISKILRTDVQKALSISYDNTTSGLTAENVQAALDELVVNLGSSDSAISALGGRLDTLEGADTIAGSVAKTVKDAVTPIETRIDTTEITLARQGQDLASVKQTLQQGNGATLDFSGIGSVTLDARATGRANPTVEGLTARNLVKNGDFSQGTTGWNTINASYSLSSNILSIIGNGEGINPRVSVPVDFHANGNYYIHLRVRVTNSMSDYVRLYTGGGGETIQGNTYSMVENEWKIITLIYKPRVTPSNAIFIAHFYSDAETANGKVMEIDGNYGVMAINLTSIFGAGNEPTEADCAKIFSYFDGTKSIQLPARIISKSEDETETSTLYIADNEEVRSVQAVSDTVSVVNGEHMLTKKISTPVSVASGVAVNVTNYPTAKTGGKFAVELTAGGTQIGIIGTDSTSGAGTLRFELATPLTINLLTSGTLKAFQNGTVYFEPYYEGSHQTNASSQIMLPYEGTIDKVYGYDEDLVEYLLDSSEYSLTGTTLTITGALENEVWFVKMSRSEPLSPEMSVNVLNNTEVTKDSITGKFYKKTFTVADGIPTFGIEEVV